MRIAGIAVRLAGRQGLPSPPACAKAEPGPTSGAIDRHLPRVAPGLRRAVAALLAALLTPAGAPLAAADVDRLVTAETPAKGLPPVRFVRAEGDLAIIELPGSYDRFTSSGQPNAAPRMAVTREYRISFCLGEVLICHVQLQRGG